MALGLAANGLESILAFVGLGLLGLGYVTKRRENHLLRAAGWVVFGLYWPTQAETFFGEGDPINGYFTWLALPLFLYLAYHEVRSHQWGEDPKALRWIAGTAFIAGATYFALYRIPPMTDFVIGQVAQQSAWMANLLFGLDSRVVVEPGAPVESRYNIWLGSGAASTYAVTIILACTAVQSIMIFVGAVATTQGVEKARRWKAYAVTAIPIYFLNLFRNAGIVYGYAVLGILPFGAWQPGSIESFEFMHSWVGKTGSLIALVAIAFVVFRMVPELHQNILDLFDLPRRKRPGFYTRAPPEPSPAPATPATSSASKPLPESE